MTADECIDKFPRKENGDVEHPNYERLKRTLEFHGDRCREEGRREITEGRLAEAEEVLLKLCKEFPIEGGSLMTVHLPDYATEWLLEHAARGDARQRRLRRSALTRLPLEEAKALGLEAQWRDNVEPKEEDQ